MGSREYAPVEIAAMIITKLKNETEIELKEPITHAVMSAPAYFNENQKNALRQAGVAAGLKAMDIIPEPIATAAAFGMDRNQSHECILAYGLDSRAFDVSLLCTTDGHCEILGIGGDRQLGGDCFNQILIDLVVDHVKKEYDKDPSDNQRFMTKLKIQASDALCSMTSKCKGCKGPNIYIPRDYLGNTVAEYEGYFDINFEISDRALEKAYPLVDRTLMLSEKVILDANCMPDDIDRVMMYGSLTSIYMVQDAMESSFGGKRIMRLADPKHCVALGADMMTEHDKRVNSFILKCYLYILSNQKWILSPLWEEMCKNTLIFDHLFCYYLR